MKRTKFVFAALLTILASGVIATTADAEEASHNSGEAETAVGIKITEPSFWLTEVSDLAFGKVETSGKVRQIPAQNDLRVKIKERRAAGSPWKLLLTFETFENESSTPVSDVKITLGEGEAKSSASGSIDGNKATLTCEQQTKLGAQIGKIEPAEVIYTIPKEKVIMNLPANTPPGKYQTTLVYVLSDAP